MFFVLTALALWLVLPRLWRRIADHRRQSAAERSFALRFTIFAWLLAFVFVSAMLFLPNKGRVLLLVPVFLTGMALTRWWQSARQRLRRAAEEESHFAQARRIN